MRLGQIDRGGSSVSCAAARHRLDLGRGLVCLRCHLLSGCSRASPIIARARDEHAAADNAGINNRYVALAIPDDLSNTCPSDSSEPSETAEGAWHYSARRAADGKPATRR